MEGSAKSMYGGLWDQMDHVGWKGSCVGVCRVRRTWRARHSQCMVVFGIRGTMEGWKGSCVGVCRARRTWRARHNQCMVVFGISGTMGGWKGSCMTLSRARRTWKAQQSQCMVVFGIRGTMKGGRGHAWGSVGPEGHGEVAIINAWWFWDQRDHGRVEGVMRGGL